MPSFSDVTAGATAAAQDVQQVINALKGVVGQGVPLVVTAVSDVTNWALDLKNGEATNSRAFRARKSDNTVLIQADTSGVQVSPDGASAAVAVSVSHAQTLTNKTLTSPTLTSPVATGSVTVTQAAAGTVLSLENDAAGGAGVVTEAYHNSASPLAADVLDSHDIYGRDSAGNKTLYARIAAILADPTNLTEDGNLALSAIESGTLRTFLQIGNFGTVLSNYEQFDALYIDQSYAGVEGVLIQGNHDSPSPAVSDRVFCLEMGGNNLSDASVSYARLQALIADPTAGSEDGTVEVHASVAGALTRIATLDASGVTVNAGNLLVTSGYIQLAEMAAPSAPAADKGRLYLVDNGAAKTLARVIFSSGAAQTFATQP